MRKILLVDDDPLFREAVCAMLYDFEITQAAEGAAALRAFRRNPDAIVLCDIFMEGIEGLEAIRDMRHANPRCEDHRHERRRHRDGHRRS